MYTVVSVHLLGAIKGGVSLHTLACSSQGKQGARIQSEIVQTDVGDLRDFCSPCVSSERQERQG